MEYSYLNQSFDPGCPLTNPMDPCQIACSGYPDLSSSCSQIGGPPGYPTRYGPSAPGPVGHHPSMRSGVGQTNGGAATASMISAAAAAAGRMSAAAAARAEHHMQTSMFPSNIGLPSKSNFDFCK